MYDSRWFLNADKERKNRNMGDQTWDLQITSPQCYTLDLGDCEANLDNSHTKRKMFKAYIF
jgi:hypothetical protein